TGTPARPKNTRGDDGRGDRGGDQQRSDSRSPWGGGGGSPWGGQPGGEVAMAPSYFSRLDQNQNGRIDPEEWEQSRRVRGMFEQAGIKLDAMDLATFTKNLERATAAAGQQQGGR
ncbi:MAG: EF-hand domain-containing protein, partial [Planctomyces sp.]